ncbi:MAG: ATP-grasp domain-containing protein [Solirubrobacteraceae bacterium]
MALCIPATASAMFEHIVASGESLSSVAATDGLSIDALAAANGISPDSQLIAGASLAIPPQDSQTTAPAEKAAPAESAAPAGGESPRGLLVNELAMRPHNSGHWTIEGAGTSQFEQHLRAVLDLPLGAPQAAAPQVVMANVFGAADLAGAGPDVFDRYIHVMAADPGVKVHMYGKAPRPGRKIGHVTVTGTDVAALRDRATRAASYLSTGKELAE